MRLGLPEFEVVEYRSKSVPNKMISELITNFPRSGELVWIGLRPKRQNEMLGVTQVSADPITGLDGEHYAGRSRNRQVTLIQHEHLAAISSFTNDTVSPEKLRRNLVVRGINLLALKKQHFQIGDVILKVTGLCHPCSRMEQVLGSGGYNAMRGHGGLTASILQGGSLSVGDRVSFLSEVSLGE